MTTHNVQLCQHEPSPYLTGFLPAWAGDKGWTLEAEKDRHPVYSDELVLTVRLRDKQSQILYAWPAYYWPSLSEVFEKCEELAGAERASPQN